MASLNPLLKPVENLTQWIAWKSNYRCGNYVESDDEIEEDGNYDDVLYYAL
ncbi:hypothetical protein Hanom_Chr15g01350221 [Helianthus anomalus]